MLVLWAFWKMAMPPTIITCPIVSCRRWSRIGWLSWYIPHGFVIGWSSKFGKILRGWVSLLGVLKGGGVDEEGAVAWISRIGRASAFLMRICWYFSASKWWVIKDEWHLNFMLLYCWESIAVVGGNVDRVFSIKSTSIIVSPQSLSWAVIWWSSKLNDIKLGKSKTLRLIQSIMAWGKKRVCSCWNLAFSWFQCSAGSLISIYCCMREWSKWWRITKRACHFWMIGISSEVSVDRATERSSAET